MGGGGVKGPYETGAMWQLAHQLDPKDVMWDVVSGISVGATNGAGISLFPKGQEK